MTAWLLALLTIAAFLVLGFLGVPAVVWAAVAAGLLFAAGAPTWVWITFGVIAAVFLLPPLRTVLVSGPTGRWLQKLGLLPAISETEQIALDAGTVWMDAELFSGKPDFRRMLSQPYPTLNEEEQAFLDGPVEEVCAMTDDWKAHCEGDLPAEVWEKLKEHRFFGMIIPKDHGGLALSAAGVSATIMKLASRSFPLSVSVMIPNSLGPAELINHYGTQEQKDEYLPKLASGEHMPCFALTEPGAGSDAGAITSRGVLFRDDDGGIKMRLSWQKRYTSLAAVSTVLGLAIKLDDPDELLGRGKKLGITCVLVPSDTPGVVIKERHDPLGVPFFNCPTEGRDVVVPIDQIIGGADGAGRGWRMLMECLAAGRGVALPASSVAGAKVAARVAGAYSAVRQQFGLPVGRFEGIEEPLARLVGGTYMMEAVRLYTCGAVDSGAKPAVVSAIVKQNMTEMIRSLVNDAMDVLAGAGISRGPRNLLANAYMASPIGITVEGANILTRTMIIYGQGAMRCHPYAYAQMRSLMDGDMAGFDRAFWGHMGHMVRNLVRSKVLSLTRGWAAGTPVPGPLARYGRRLSWASSNFALLADLSMITLGGDLKRREKFTGRMADILSGMYIATAVMRRFEAEGRREEDLPLATWALDDAFDRIQAAFAGAYANFPVRFLGALLRGPVAFWHRVNPMGTPPRDELGSKLAEVIRRPSEQRDRLLADMYIPSGKGEAMRRLEDALAAVVAAEEPVRKIKKAIRKKVLPKAAPVTLLEEAVREGIITEDEATLIRAAAAAREDAIQVDAFPLADHLVQTPRPGTPVTT